MHVETSCTVFAPQVVSVNATPALDLRPRQCIHQSAHNSKVTFLVRFHDVFWRSIARLRFGVPWSSLADAKVRGLRAPSFRRSMVINILRGLRVQ